MIGILRSNENELKKEIQRVRDVMQTQTPGTAEYGMTEEQIKAIRKFDEGVEKSDREFYEHTTLMCDLKKKKKKSYTEG